MPLWRAQELRLYQNGVYGPNGKSVVIALLAAGWKTKVSVMAGEFYFRPHVRTGSEAHPTCHPVVIVCP